MIGSRPACYECEHFNSFDVGRISCAAFPDGIPDEIIFGKPHLKPIRGQKNKIVFQKYVFVNMKKGIPPNDSRAIGQDKSKEPF